MVIRNYHWLNSASRVLISTCSAPLVQTGEHKQFSLFDIDLWPTILTYNPRLAKVKGDPHAKIKVKGQTVQTGERPQTNGRTDASKRIIAPATRSIKKILKYAVSRKCIQQKSCAKIKTPMTIITWHWSSVMLFASYACVLCRVVQ